MLQARIETIKEYLIEVQEGTAGFPNASTYSDFAGKRPPNEHMLKEIASLLYRLPAASSQDFHSEFEKSWGSVLLSSLFTEILKGTGDIYELGQKVAVTTDGRRKRQGMAGRMGRGRGMGPFSDNMGFDSHPFFNGPWGGKEI